MRADDGRRGIGRPFRALAAGVAAAVLVCGACASPDDARATDVGGAAATPTENEAGGAPSPTPVPTREPECFGSDDPAQCVPAEALPPGWSFEVQDLVSTYTMRLHEALSMNEDLLTIIWDPLTIEVAWPEPLPATLDPLIAEAASDGITIVWREIAMSQAEAEALVMQLADALTAAEIAWTAIGPEQGYTGIRVGTPEALDEAGQERIRQIAAEVTPGMSITFEVTGEVTSLTEVEQTPGP